MHKYSTVLHIAPANMHKHTPKGKQPGKQEPKGKPASKPARKRTSKQAIKPESVQASQQHKRNTRNDPNCDKVIFSMQS
jgi:hypothetical protein